METFKTNSLGLAAYLTALGYNVKEIDRNKNQNKSTFILDMFEDIQEVSKQFFRNDKVPVQDLFDSLKRVKSMLYEFK